MIREINKARLNVLPLWEWQSFSLSMKKVSVEILNPARWRASYKVL